MQLLVSNFTEEQLDRYSMYRRAAFPKVDCVLRIYFSMYMSIDLKLFTLQKPKLHPQKVEFYLLIWQQLSI